MLALEYNIHRAKQDQYGHLSHKRAAAAQQEGRFHDEIMPIETSVYIDPEGPESGRRSIVVDKDDGIRHGLSLEDMAKAPPAFKGVGEERSTGPNSSQVTDGAAMVVMMRRRKAEELGYPILATHIGTSIVGVPPKVMGRGPVEAIP